MDDKLKEKAERGVLDNMLSTAQSALAIGAGAVFLYRGGGREVLSKASSVTNRVLGGVQDDLRAISGRKIETTDIREISRRALSGDNSYLKQGMRNAEEGMRFRGYDQSTFIGQSLQSYSMRSRTSAQSMARSEIEFQEVIQPQAKYYANMYGKTEREKQKVGAFTETVFKNLEKMDTILAQASRTGVDKIMDVDDILKMRKELREAKKNTAGDISSRARQLKGVSEQIDQEVFGLDSLRAQAEKQQTQMKKLFNTTLGDRGVTVKDVLDNPDQFRGTTVSWQERRNDGSLQEVTKDAVEFLQRFRSKVAINNKENREEALEVFGDMVVDGAIRKDASGKVYNMTGIADATNNMLEGFAGTMPGKIFKVRDILEAKKSPSAEVFRASLNNANKVLANMVNDEKNRHMLTVDKDIYKINDKHFRLDSKGNLQEIEGLQNTRLITRYGATSRLLNSMVGNESYRPTTGNKFLDKLDIARDGQPNMLSSLKSAFAKHTDSEWSGNAIRAFSSDREETSRQIKAIQTALQDPNLSGAELNELSKSALAISNQAKIVESLYKKTTHALSQKEAGIIADQMNPAAKEYARLSAMQTDDLIQETMNRLSANPNFETPGLNKIVSDLARDPRRTENMLLLKDSPVIYSKQNSADKLADQLRIEYMKEAMMIQGREEGLMSIRKLIDESPIQKTSKMNLRRISDWAIVQRETGIGDGFSTAQSAEVANILDAPARMAELFQKSDGKAYYKQMVENLEQMGKNHVSDLGSDYGVAMRNSGVEEAMQQGEFIHLQRMVSPIDVLRDLNDTTKTKAFFKQFVAGRNDQENITGATLVPYFFTERLSSALSYIGLSVSNENKGSTIDMIKSFTLHRGLPIVGGMTAYDYINDMHGVLTGQNLSSTILSGVANADLGMRRFADATGISEFLDKEKDLNPFYRYWTGDDFMTAEEREDWYQNGSQEMRKGRWWSFGGIQEFRGSQVQYYQPNWLRRSTSNWKDESLYNNVWDKWSHSWVPTPTNPISPLIYLADPYWMERRFADERPYPMTGKMFTEETPWGPALNATIGEIIKPQKRMHTDRLDENYVDSKVLIERENQLIYERARNQNEDHLVRFKDGAIEAITYTNTSAPTPGERIVSVVDGQPIAPRSYGEHFGVMRASDVYEKNPLRSGISDSVLGEASGLFGGGGLFGFGGGGGEGSESYGFSTVEDLSFKDRMEVAAAGGSLFGGLFSTIMRNTAIDQLSGMNQEIQTRARENAKMAAIGTPEGEGIINTQSIYKAGASFGSEVLGQAEALNELKGLSSGDDFLGEMAYTLRFAAGIYGYGSYAMFPGKPSMKLADASNIDSPVRGFWDANLGGLGGGYLEIFRRFIPAQNHRQELFNPLLNTMPDWMPEKFRFGDPYATLPKGEMRMPGRGFESINQLHPDQYGEYGAFDRMKILADIAPTSHEYKVWRDIADRTVADESLRNEMENIKDRVANQGKAYDFFDYRFLGRDATTKSVYVDKVTGRDTFTIVGDDTVYRLAGLEVTAKKEDFDLAELLMSGSKIRMTTDDNPYTGVNDDAQNTTSAVVHLDKQNINELLLDQGVAREREDNSAALMGNYTDFQIMRGKAYEALSHLPVVYFSQKFFRIRDPLESWKQEMTYGTSYASWSNPIDTFLKPAMERALMSDTEVLAGGAAALLGNWTEKNVENKTLKYLGRGAYMLGNRGAFIGGFFGYATTGGFGKTTNRLMNVGAAAQLVGWAATRDNQPIEGTIGGALIGATVGNMLGDVGKLKGAKIGALVGLAYTGMNTSLFNDGLNAEYIPERTREKWERQEYFDRLNYIKYSGLFEKAADVAKRKEGVDIEQMVEHYDKSREQNFELRQRLEDAKSIVEKAYAGSDERGQRLTREIESKLKLLDDQEFSVSVGEYGKSALMYKQMMDSTTFGLAKDASWAELVRAVPQNERTHFIEFFKEKDPKRREEILRYVSPYTAKVLKIAWGEEPDDLESNESYFKDMNVPAPTWSGWRPDIDLKDVQVKTIQNEGMLLADFGYYESQLRDPDVVNAPSLDPDRKSGPLSSYLGLKASLEGLGLMGVNVSVSPTSKSGVEVIANIMDKTLSAPGYVEGKIRDALSF